MKSILITGHRGFIGSQLFKACEDYESYGVDYYDDPNSDLTDSQCVLPIADIIVHLAAKACIRYCNNDPINTYRNNTLSTIRILEHAKQHSSRVVFISSSNAREPFSNIYGHSKSACEQLCRHYNHCYGVPIQIIRPHNVYGPRSKTSVIGIYEKCMQLGLPLPIYGSGVNLRDYTHIDDVVMGIKLAINRDQYDINPIHLGTGVTYSVTDIAKMFGGAVERYPPIFGELPISCADTTNASQVLGWKSTIDLPTYIDKFKLSLAKS